MLHEKYKTNGDVCLSAWHFNIHLKNVYGSEYKTSLTEDILTRHQIAAKSYFTEISLC